MTTAIIQRGATLSKREKLSANEKMIDAMRREEERRAVTAASQQMETEERAAIRDGVRDRLNKARADHEEVEEVSSGPVRVLSRDGLLWLIQKGRINESQRIAAERYRRDYAKAHMGEIKVPVMGEVGGKGGSDFTALKIDAVKVLKEARDKGLLGDAAMISLLDLVAGEGKTLIALALQDRRLADALEVEFRVGCRLLARHYGYAS